jgi:hypothetical protein
MTNHFKNVLLASILLLGSTSIARAELVVYDLGNSAARTLQGLGTAFIMGCTVLAIGAIVAAFVSRKK